MKNNKWITLDELKVTSRTMSLSGINPWIIHNAGARGYMSATALSGVTQICNPQESIVQSTHVELGKGIMNVIVDVDSEIYTYFIKRDRSGGIIELVLVLVDVVTREHFSLKVPRYSDNNYTYGFEYLWEPIVNNILNGITRYLPKSTVIARTPGSKENMGYALGITFQTIGLSHPTTAEDCYLITESASKRGKVKVYSRITISYGLNSVLTNSYGNTNQYKPFPYVGEKLRDDRMVCTIRKFDETNILTRCHKKAMLDTHPAFDECVYAPHPNGKVVNIEVVESPRNKKGVVDLNNYIKTNVNRENQFYESIVRYNDKVSKDPNIILDPELTNLVVKAKFNMLAINQVGKVIKKKNKDRLDLYTVTFTIEHELVLNNGYKMTNLHGGL